MKKLLKAVPIVSFTVTVILGILYKITSLDVWLTLAITFGTITYHFAMRLLVALVYNSTMHNKADYKKRWYQVGEVEKKVYEKLRVKSWKNRMPTYDADIFNPRLHTWEQIAQATCQAELVHETIAVLSFLPIMAGIRFGAYPVRYYIRFFVNV